MSNDKNLWKSPKDELGRFIQEEVIKTLNAYEAQPKLVQRDYKEEREISRGDYAHRQLFEIIQNSADAVTSRRNRAADGKIEINLTSDYLYCADNGRSLDKEGATALMFTRLSTKEGTSQIGRFGLGFRSLLNLSDSIQFFSRNVSFEFDRTKARKKIKTAVDGDRDYPMLSMPFPICPTKYGDDPVLKELMQWACNIVRLKLNPDAKNSVKDQLQEFPAEFLLFQPRIQELNIKDHPSSSDDEMRFSRNFRLIENKEKEEFSLSDGEENSVWKVFKCNYILSSDKAKEDGDGLHNNGEVPMWWAVPLKKLDQPGFFWSFFPTNDTSLVAGILNSRWKTYSNRLHLLGGPYNTELIDAAVKLIIKSLIDVYSRSDPARHLHILPRRRESGDNQFADSLREKLHDQLRENKKKIVPVEIDVRFYKKLLARKSSTYDLYKSLGYFDELRWIENIKFPPQLLEKKFEISTKLYKEWAELLPINPDGWLHHKAYSRRLLATIGRLFPNGQIDSSAKASIREWLEALHKEAEDIETKLEASKNSIKIASKLPKTWVRSPIEFGSIILTATENWNVPDPKQIFLAGPNLPAELLFEEDNIVHPDISNDETIRQALGALGIRNQSKEDAFNICADTVLQGEEVPTPEQWEYFWFLAEELGQLEVKKNYERLTAKKRVPHVRTRCGSWRSVNSTLIPGEIVEETENEDLSATIDLSFHEDIELIKSLGATEMPQNNRDLSSEIWFDGCLRKYRKKYRRREYKKNKRKPHKPKLKFKSTLSVGPLKVLGELSECAKARYSSALLSQDATYDPWIMYHTTRPIDYRELSVESPVIFALRRFGRIETNNGTVPFEQAIGNPPGNLDALHKLLKHPNAEKIKEAFNLADPIPEIVGEEDSEPLFDIWPGLSRHLNLDQEQYDVVFCEEISVLGETRNCIAHDSVIYIVRRSTDSEDIDYLQNACIELGLRLNDKDLQGIIDHNWTEEVRRKREEIRKCATDAQRLLKAVGVNQLRAKLPGPLLEILRNESDGLTDIVIAEASLATHHSDALRVHKDSLQELDPPYQWAGSTAAKKFVVSLGFPEEWAGERNQKRSPFEEIDGPYSLPELHDYQRDIGNELVKFLSNLNNVTNRRRAMICLPTGSGKTRVTVQGIVEALRDQKFKGGILWVADRDELCEQAVEAWCQVWSGVGSYGDRLLISRMWGGQRIPQPRTELHVVVSTIQTLYSKLAGRISGYEFLNEFKLIVVDEAHRSIAPTFTSVMQDLGLTRRQGGEEPILLGLTATPYRGFNEAETLWLVNRYSNRRLDQGVFSSDDSEQIVKELQNKQILAYADHEEIEGGNFPLTDDERDEADISPWLPKSVENRIAEDTERTLRIVEDCKKCVKKGWPTLVFATSVTHAETVAAQLCRQGISSRAVSGKTESILRRKIVKEFQSGEVEALVNYAVFREGFDAPRTRAIIVARPVYSPNLYFQMIGRGLRGPKNGGNDRCMILNVEDNIENFQRQLAFTELDWLWA